MYHPEQERIPCVIMRGGTSKAVFLLENDLPAEPQQRDRVILAIFGSPDSRQIDGLGGAFGLILGMTGSCALLLLVSVLATVGAVTP